MYEVCERNEWGDPFSYARSREIHMSILLKHTIASTYSGADAIDDNGAAEYKTTIQDTISGSYRGISVQPTWEEQERYLIEDKIACYKNHYFARFVGSKIVELYCLDGNAVLDILIPKLKKQYERYQTSKPKDPRLNATVTKTEIYKYGRKIIG